jgi:hypothetical protein
MVLRILAALLMIAPAAMIWIGLKKSGKGQPAAGLGMFAGGGILLFVLAAIATGYILYPLMLCLSITLIVAKLAASKQGAIWGRPVAVCCALLIAVTATLSIVWQVGGGEARRGLDRRNERSRFLEETRMEAAGKVLGDALAGRRALILILGYDSEFTRAGLAALKKGLGEKLSVVGVVAATGADGPTGKGDPLAATAEEFDRMLDSRDDYDLVISMIGRPDDILDMTYWDRETARRHKFVFTHFSTYDLWQQMQLGWVEGTVMRTKEYEQLTMRLLQSDQEFSAENVKEVAGRGLFFVSMENIEEMYQKYPEKFPDIEL